MAIESVESIIRRKNEKDEKVAKVADVIIEIARLHGLSLNEVIKHLERRWTMKP